MTNLDPAELRSRAEEPQLRLVVETPAVVGDDGVG